jgi:hypothetical protein
MQIIEPGKLERSLKCRARCVYCKTVVEFTVGEAVQVDDRNETGYKIACPTAGCVHEIWFWGKPK